MSTEQKPADPGFPVNGGGNEDGGFSEDIPWSAAGGGRTADPRQAGPIEAAPGLPCRDGGPPADPSVYAEWSDTRIADDIRARLLESGYVEASDLVVEVKGGTATLSGSVSDPRLREDAEQLVRRCSGVLRIDNRLRVLRTDEQVGG